MKRTLVFSILIKSYKEFIKKLLKDFSNTKPGKVAWDKNKEYIYHTNIKMVI